MSAAAQLPDPTPLPDPPRATTPIPAALGRVLGVLRKLIDYGRHLAATVHQRAAAPGFDRLLVYPFGTADIAVILTRITNGLRRAAALEAALLQRAASGRDLTPSPIRLPSSRTPRPARQVAPPEAQPTGTTEHPHLLTEAEIAAELRRRPVGAVIADICRDLGIAPGQFDRAFWDELRLAIIVHGGNLATFLGDMRKRLAVWILNPPTPQQIVQPPPYPPSALALATGPP